MAYRTIVADPPWDYSESEGVAVGVGHGILEHRPFPYPVMSFEDICALPVYKLADVDCRLFLWATNRYLEDAFTIMRAWRFKYRQTLVWHKRDVNLMGSIAPNSAEFVLVGTRGSPERTSRIPSAVLSLARRGGHSAKPQEFLDYFEQVSPGPYVELFARQHRLGWDVWGDESANTAGLVYQT